MSNKWHEKDVCCFVMALAMHYYVEDHKSSLLTYDLGGFGASIIADCGLFSFSVCLVVCVVLSLTSRHYPELLVGLLYFPYPDPFPVMEVVLV